MAKQSVTYEVHVRKGEAGWHAPSVGNLPQLGFFTREEAEELIDVMLRIDGDYYRGSQWRIVKVLREVVFIRREADLRP